MTLINAMPLPGDFLTQTGDQVGDTLSAPFYRQLSAGLAGN